MLASLLVLAVLVASASARRGEPVLASRANGVGADGDSSISSISADGRFVAFHSDADNLSAGDDNNFFNVFVRDLQAGTTALVSQANGVGANSESLSPSISADGRFVAFESVADNLSTGDNNSFRNVFVRDLQAGTTTLVSQANGVGADSDSLSPSISADGRFVAFESDADNLSADDLNTVRNVFVRDTGLSTTTLVNYGIAGAGADGHSVDPSISADGRFVAFESEADNLSADDLNTVSNVFVRDTAASTTTLVNYGIAGAGADGHSFEPSISADGRFVAFASEADNLSADDLNTVSNVFVRDTAASTTTLVNYGIAGAGADGDSLGPSISADGRYVAFYSGANNLSADDNDGVSNVFVRDTGAGMTTFVSHRTGAAADGHSLNPSITANGRFVAFESAADNLSAGDNDSFRNIFRQDLVGPAPVCSNVAQAVARDFATIVPLTCADADGDPVTRSISSSPAHGTLGAINQAAGTVTYTPDPGYVGPDSFSFQAADASGASNTATATLTVTEPPPASSPPANSPPANSPPPAGPSAPAAPAPVPPGTGPVAALAAIRALRLAPRAFRAARGGPSARAAQRRRTGTIVSFTLNQDAAVRYRVARARPGRRAGRRCVAPNRRNRGARRCTRLVAVRGTFSRNAAAGRNRFHFTGRIARRKLVPGSYELRATPRSGGRNGATSRARFRIAR